MANNSDHTKPATDINQLLPEVFKSDVNNSLFSTSFNRHLTKDDTSRVSGFIGESNADAVVDRRIKEATPHRQAFQLAPTMASTVGTEEYALSFKAFLQQLTLMGVDVNRLPVWGSTLQFNWVPPVNIDMLVNYQDYFWKPTVPTDQPQYLTIENRCNKAKSKVASYQQILVQQGRSFPVVRVNHLTSELVITQKHDDLFVSGFVFYTKDSTNVNMQDRFWEVETSVFDADAGETIIKVHELSTNKPTTMLATTDPVSGSFVGEWYFNTTTNQLKEWTGATWTAISTAIALTISLEERLAVFQAQANCACNSDLGWDIAQWDDNPMLWNDDLLTSISSTTAPALPSNADLWYDTLNDELKQFNGTDWIVVTANFSAIIADTTGTSFWDVNTSCDTTQHYTQWSVENQWVHKSEVQSATGAKRAQLPIIEYDSSLELNEWVRANYKWKYRAETDQSFVDTTSAPSRFELEPIKGYVASYDSGVWTLYLYHKDSGMCRDADYTDTFVPGYRFRVTDDSNVSQAYTVATAEYREITAADTALVTSNVGVDVMCTVITIVEPLFTSIQVAPGNLTVDPARTRIEPIQTSQGHTWRGYHAHWVLDVDAITFSPTAHQRWNFYRQRSIDEAIALTPGSILEFPTDFSAGVYGVAHQEYTVGVTGVTQVLLHPTLTYSATTPQMFATPGSNEVRVYVNDVRQYGNYVELTDIGTPYYTVVGQTSISNTENPNITIPYVTGIVFNQPLNLYDVVRIEVGPAPFNCMGNNAIPVRTIEDEVEFTLAVAAGTQPVYRSMTQCYHLEQSKTILNQYPLFNVYDVTTSQVIDANSVFSFAEDSDYDVNPNVQRRIVATSDGKEYQFEQHLIDRDDNIIYAYKSIQPIATYWHSPITNTTLHWNGYAWSDRVVVSVVTGDAVRRIITSAEPKPATTLEMSLWFDTNVNKLFQYVSGSWVEITDVVINGTDPLLRTIWRHGLNNEVYVPQYVDAKLVPITEGSPLGDWEVVDQWMYNSEHSNRKRISYSQLVTHLRSIIDGQPKIPGLQGGGIYTLTQNEFNYAVGGTIKEHNDSFDTLISAVNVNNVTPIGVIEFASREYASCLLRVRDIFNKSIVDLLGNYSRESIANLPATVSERVINTYELNDFASSIYGDTSAYDPETGLGVKNWIATIPMFGLGPRYIPHMSLDGQAVQMFHHDGHRSTISYTTAEIDRLARQVCSQPDKRVTGGKLGVVSTATPPATETAFTTAFGGGEVRPGVYWYQTSGTRTLYRFEAYDVANVDPSIYDVFGNEIPDGVMYFNKSFNVARTKVGGVWQDVGTPVGDVSALWQVVSIPALLGETILTIEQRLYEVTPNIDPVFDYSALETAEPTVYQNALRRRFDTFVSNNDITAPLVNVEYTASDAFTWNYVGSVFGVNTFPRLINGVETPANPEYDVSSWQELYTRVYGTPYPHLEPWKLQGYNNKPTWWDEEYADITGSRRWKYTHSTTTGMWENIRTGNVPAGRSYPDGTISTGDVMADGMDTTMPTYRYFSVNIGDTPIGSFAPDAVLPPYYSTVDLVVRSLFTSTAQITNPSADYAFGDVGPTEWMWSTSYQQPYDLSVVAFIMQPVKFLHSAFGVLFTTVDNLQVDTLSKQVYSHKDVLFHGDIYNTNDVYKVRGINQWYVNYNRYTGFDANLEFRELWANWSPRMTYQFGGIVDTSSFDITSKYFDVSEQDYNIVLANSGVIKDLWADAFEVSILTIPPAIVQYNNQHMWKFELDSLAATPRSIPYYGVHHYPMTVDITTNTIKVNTVSIVAVSVANRRFYVGGDHTLTIAAGSSIGVSGAGANNGSYTVSSTLYDTGTNRTRITVEEAIAVADVAGIIEIGVSLPWVTGDMVVVSSSKFTPAPLLPNTAYYVVKLSPNTIQLADTQRDAIANNVIDITTAGEGVLYVSQIASSFEVYGGASNTAELWYHYAIDRNTVRNITPPMTVVGMQTLISIIDGYAAYQNDHDIINNGTAANDFDPTTGRLVDWQVETERFMDWAFGLRQSRIRVSDKYDVSVNTTTNEFTFTGMVPHWVDGTPVVVQSTGILPQPLIAGATYHVVSTGVLGTIKLSITSNTSDVSAHVDITSTGSGQVSIGLLDSARAYPRFELNPYRNNIWIETPQGVLSNVIEGPCADIRIQQTIFDQYSRPLTADKLVALREDKINRIAIRPNIANDIDKIYQNDPYNYLHIGGAHLFIEGYEHYLMFNDYTVSGALMYDAFLGLWAKRYNLEYFEKQDYTLRPTLGGYYLIDQQFERNLEGSIDDMRLFYDVLGLPETTNVTRRARNLLGYRGNTSFLDLLNVNSKSQFMFYRGMIQSKGSVNSIKAYINSRRFVDAKLDDFWAWKVAEYGDSSPRVYPEIKIFSSDAGTDDIRLEFLGTSETEQDPDVVDSINKGFKVVSFSTPERWYEFPEQKSVIGSPLFLDAEVSSLTSIFAHTAAPTFTLPAVDYWYNTVTDELFSRDTNGDWTVAEMNVVVPMNVDVAGLPTDVVYIHHSGICDDVRVIRKAFDTAPPIGTDYTTEDYTTESFGAGADANTYFKVNSKVVRLNKMDLDTPNGCVLQIFTINPAKSKISPAKLIDKASNTVLQQLPLWHPALGHHSPVAIHNVDIQSPVDPARYNYTLNPQTSITDNWDENFWNQMEVGTVWMNTNSLGYVPYYDDQVFSNINDRLYNWGRLAPWASVKVYEWVESTVTPELWTGSGSPLASTFVRTRDAATVVTNVSVVTSEFTTALPFVDGDSVVVVLADGGMLPTGVESSYVYTVTNVTNGGLTFTLFDPREEIDVVITAVDADTISTGKLSVIKTFDPYDWVEHKLIHQTLTVPELLRNNGETSFDSSYITNTVTWLPTSMDDWKIRGTFPADTTVDVYVNGTLAGTSTSVVVDGSNLKATLPAAVTLYEHDLIEVVRPVHTLTSAEESFDPDVYDDGTELVQWKREYQYSTNTHLIDADDKNSSKVNTYYYFWVEGSTNRDTTVQHSLSALSIAEQIESIPTPYLIVQRPKDDPYLLNRYGYGILPYSSAYSLGMLPEETYQVPVLYREAIVRGVIPYVINSDSCVVRFTRDWSLRDSLTNPPVMKRLKNKHEEWVLFRRSQPSTIPRQLWDKLTEALIGYTLTDATVRVPALERELYDATYGTDTQYGLGEGQTFVQKDIGLATVLAYLTDPKNDFKPQDIDAFFDTYSFDTPESIREAMDVIYTSFNAAHVNAIWFEVLHDSLSLRAKYKELMKTSWIALHGIRVLEVGGLFDD
mgnify:CR=1 FL=1